MVEKMTYVMALNAAVNCMALPEEVRVKLSLLMGQMEKKSTAERKPSKTQNLNTELQSVILASMEFNEPYTVSDLIANIPEINSLSNQKVSAMVKALVDNGMVTRTTEKGKAFFTKTA